MKKLLTIGLLLCLMLLFGCNDNTTSTDVPEENVNLGIRTFEASDDETEFVRKFLEDYCIYEYNVPDDVKELEVLMEQTKGDKVVETEILNTFNLSSNESGKAGTIALSKVGEDTYNLCVEENKDESGKYVQTYNTYDIELAELPEGYTVTSIYGGINISNQEVEIGKRYPIYKVSFDTENQSLEEITNTVYIVFS